MVVGKPDATPAAEAERRQLILNDYRGGVPAAQLSIEQEPDTSASLRRTIEHLPTGIVHVLFAPFPWMIRRLADLATIPDMLLWYGLMVCAAWTIVHKRADWRSFAHVALFIAGTLSAFALFEGNVGILFRHRGTVIPYFAMLAGPGAAGALAWVASRRSTLARRDQPSTVGPTRFDAASDKQEGTMGRA